MDSSYTATVDDVGEGPAVVLLHGTPLDAQSWDGLAPALAGRRRVVRYDLRGHGTARSCPVPSDYGAFAGDLALVLNGLEIERAHVLGHSFGGQVA